MKTSIRRILVIAVMLGMLTAYANETLDSTPTHKVMNKGDYIIVTSSAGKVIFEGNVNYNGQLTKLIDFSQLTNDIYTIEITKDFEIEIIDLKVEDKSITFLTDSQEKIFKPVLRAENGMLIVSKIAFDSNEMTVKIYYKGNLIYLDKISENNDILNRVYKLDISNPGDYKAVVKTNNRVYTEYFRI